LAKNAFEHSVELRQRLKSDVIGDLANPPLLFSSLSLSLSLSLSFHSEWGNGGGLVVPCGNAWYTGSFCISIARKEAV
jgi:hypothetical protein